MKFSLVREKATRVQDVTTLSMKLSGYSHPSPEITSDGIQCYRRIRTLRKVGVFEGKLLYDSDRVVSWVNNIWQSIELCVVRVSVESGI